jgi:hypothetical protein
VDIETKRIFTIFKARVALFFRIPPSPLLLLLFHPDLTPFEDVYWPSKNLWQNGIIDSTGGRESGRRQKKQD